MNHSPLIFTVTVTWNGTTITGPVLIFQDELVIDNRPDFLDTPKDGTVICKSKDQTQVGWTFPNGVFVQTSATTHFRQRRTGSSATPSVSRLTTNRPDEALTSAAANGLWTCRLNGGIPTAVPVGIYARRGGEKQYKKMSHIKHYLSDHGAITSNQVSLSSFSFQSDPPNLHTAWCYQWRTTHNLHLDKKWSSHH